MHGFRGPLLALLAVTVLGGCSTVAGVPVKAKVVQPTVALDGLYRIVADGTGTSNGKEVDNLPRSDEQWAFRTVCDAEGCVATGAIVDRTDRTTAPADVVIAGYVDGVWSMVTVAEDKCDALGKRMPANHWTLWDIAGSPSKALSLNRIDVLTEVCNSIDVTTPTITRIGDRPPEIALPDPSEHLLLSDAPNAEAFRGNYDLTTTIRGDPDSAIVENDDVTTTCLRGGDRCVTTAVSTEPFEDDGSYGMFTVELVNGKFVGRYSSGSPPCNGSVGGLKTDTMTMELPRGPVMGPFETLTGERVTTFTGGCDEIVADLLFERIR